MTEPMTPERFIAKYRRSHLEVEDTWYSCPLSTDGCANEDEEGCLCGAEEWNTSMPDDLRAAVAHVVTEERTRCAKIVLESGYRSNGAPSLEHIAERIMQDAIRARGQEPPQEETP